MEVVHSNQVVRPATHVEQELETRKVFGSFVLFLFGMSVPYFLMINVRFIMAAGFVPSSSDQTTGAIEAILTLISGLTAWAAIRAIRGGNTSAYRVNLGLTLVLGWVSTLMMAWEWWYHPFDAMSHYGETFLSTVGLVVVMNLSGLLTLWASRARAKRLGSDQALVKGYRLAGMYWIFLVVAALVMYIELYFA